MRILITGAKGRLGAALADGLLAAGHDVTPLGRRELDICDVRRVSRLTSTLRPHVIVNCSAYNAVDAAEADPAVAFTINATGPAVLAACAASTGALLVHYSSDFVFDGETAEPYTEECPANPLSVYGTSKLAGEEEVRKASRHYILRVESLFGSGRGATIDRFIERMLVGLPVPAFVDRTVSPSYVPDVVAATAALLEVGGRYGTYHCVNSGYATWYALALELAACLGVPPRVEATLSGTSRAAAARPRFCALSNRKLRGLGIVLPDWQSAIARHAATYGVAAQRPSYQTLPA